MKVSLFFLFFVTLILSACSGEVFRKDEAKTDEPVLQSLSACGLGDRKSAYAVYQSAYDFAQRSAGEFKKKMTKGVEVQLAALQETYHEKDGVDFAAFEKIILATQKCMINYADQFRPKERSELIDLCRKEFEKGISVRATQWLTVSSHSKNTPNIAIISAAVNGNESWKTPHSFFVRCEFSGNRVIDVGLLPAVNNNRNVIGY